MAEQTNTGITRITEDERVKLLALKKHLVEADRIWCGLTDDLVDNLTGLTSGDSLGSCLNRCDELIREWIIPGDRATPRHASVAFSVFNRGE